MVQNTSTSYSNKTRGSKTEELNIMKLNKPKNKSETWWVELLRI